MESAAEVQAGSGPSGAPDVAAPAQPARPVFGAVRAGLWGLVVETIWIAWFLVGAQLLAAIVVFVPFTVLFAGEMAFPERALTAWFQSLLGPLPSLLPVAQVVAICAYLGWYLPGRIIVATGWEPREVRRTVAVIGLAGGSLVVWLVPMGLDVVLATGFALAPLAFVATALRAPVPPVWRLTRRAYLAFAGILVVGNMALVLALVNPPVPALRLELTAAGLPMETVGLSPDDIAVRHWARGSGSAATAIEWVTTVDAWDPSASALDGFTAIAVEVWPARVQDGILALEGRPIANVEEAVPLHHDRMAWAMPALRDPVLVARVTIGVLPDGRRILLDADPDVGLTPPWRGNLLGWWLGG